MAIAKTHPGFGGASPYPGAFVKALRAALEAKGWRIVRWRGIALEIGRGPDRGILEPEIPYRRLRHLRRERWEGVLAEWLGVMPAKPWEGEEGNLIPLIANPFLRSILGEKIAYAVLIPQDLALVAVRGEGETRNLLTEEAIQSSERPGTEIFEAAIEAVASRTPHEAYRALENEFGIHEAAVGDGLDASRVFLLDEHFRDAPDGFFVALPSRDRLLFLPVRQETLPAAPRLQQLAEETFRCAVHPITNRLYWVRAGSWGVFGVRREPGRVEVVPPPEFVEVLQRLLPEASQPPALPSPPPPGPAEGDMPN